MYQYEFNCRNCELSIRVQIANHWFSHRKCPRCQTTADVIEKSRSEISSFEFLKAVATNRFLNTVEKIRSELRSFGSIAQVYKTSKVEISGPKYLYLSEAEHARTWIDGGGPVPIKLASTYLSKERAGTNTPDENLIHSSPVDLASLSPGFHLENVKDITIINCTINGVRVPDIRNANFYRDDGLVLCFSNTLSIEICKKLHKKVCVAIDDIEGLKQKLDLQIGSKSTAGSCNYTNNHERNHFLKHEADAWMDEYRLFWTASKDVSVMLPKGMARICEMS